MSISRLLKFTQRQECLKWWEWAWGADFERVRPFFSPCSGKRGSFYPCEECSEVQLEIRECRGAYAAYAMGELSCFYQTVYLEWGDVQAYRVDSDRIMSHLREHLKIKPQHFQPLENLHPVGHCPVGDRSVYASLHTDFAQNLSIAAGIHGPEAAGCIIFPERFDHVEPLLQGKGIASIFLDEACSSTRPECQQGCRKLQQDLTNLELKQHMDSRIDLVGRKFADLEAENERLKGDLAKVIAHIASQVDPEYFKWIYMILASGSARKAADSLNISSSTFDRQLKEFSSRGGMYKTLFALISVRRKCGTKSVEGYNPAFALHQQAALSDSSVISDLLDGLRALNATNWQAVQQELIELVEEEFGTLLGN